MPADLFQRLEFKYLIDEQQAEQVRRLIAPYCEPDEYNGTAGLGYPIYSLYLDTPSYAFHLAKLRNDADRVKLRARVYDDSGPVHLEVKRKHVDVIHKTRVAVPRDQWVDAARGFGPRLEGRKAAHLEAFAHLAAQSGAEPKLLVQYEREAYASTVDQYARVTFDRAVRASTQRSWSIEPDGAWVVLDAGRDGRVEGFTLLELKAELLMPYWMVDLVRELRLKNTGFSKYSSGIIATRNLELGLFETQRGMYA